MKDKKFVIKLSILLSILLFLIISVTLNASYIIDLDAFVFSGMHYIRSSIVNNIFLIITLFAQTLTILIILYALWLFPNRFRVALPLSICMALSTLLNSLLKFIVNRARPVGEFVGNLIFKYPFPSSSSFPSGHTQAGLVFYYVLITIIIKECNIKNVKTQKILKLSSIIFALLIGLSRLILGVHFFSDVLTGFILGWIIILIYKKFENKIFHKQLEK